MAVGYQLRLLVFRQSALVPTLLYLALVAAIYASDAGQPVPAASVTAVALMPICAWLSRLVATSESPPFAEVTLVSLGGPRRHLLVRAATTLVVGAALTAISTVWAVLANSNAVHPYRRDDLLIIVGMSLAECIAGIGLGLWIEPPARAGTAALVVALVSLVSLVVAWFPPLGPLLRGLYQPPVPGPFAVLGYVLQAVAFGGVLLTARAVHEGRATNSSRGRLCRDRGEQVDHSSVRVLISVAPSMGHIIPLLDIGGALQDAGHDVRVATHESRHGLVAGAGLEPVAVGISSDEMVAERLRRWPETAQQPATAWAVRMWVEVMAPATFRGLVPLMDAWRPRLVLHDEGEYGAPMAAAAVGVPWVTHAFGSPLRPVEELRELEEVAEQVWDAVGQRMPAHAGLYEHGLINPCPSMLQSAAPGATVVWPVRPQQFRGDGATVEADAYVGFGTVPTFADAPQELHAAVRACAALGMRVVVTARTPELREQLAAIDPDHVVAEQFVALPSLLRSCKVVITHAGAGTVLAALTAGVPLVLAPRGSPSQVRMAFACDEAGVGRSCDAAGIATAVEQVLSDPTYARAAGQAADQIASMPSAADVVRQLEELASR